MAKLIEAVQKYSTELILESVKVIGGGQVSEELRMARAALIEVYMQREGEEAADSLMDELGM